MYRLTFSCLYLEYHFSLPSPQSPTCQKHVQNILLALVYVKIELGSEKMV